MKKFYKVLFFSSLCLAQIFSIAQPTITSFAPTSGPVGTVVTITGTNFNTTPANNIVFFGATQAIVNTGTTTSLDVIVPLGATYQYISVTDLTTGLTASSMQQFVTTFICGGIINSNSFTPKIDSAAGNNPYNIAIGDFDGDGKSDLAIVNEGVNTVSVLRNTSSGGSISFASKVNFTMGGANSIAIADLDGDGMLDLTVTGGGILSVFRNLSISGTILFAPKVDFIAGGGEVAVGDLDGDGKLDLAVTDANLSIVSVSRNTGSIGTISFATKVDFTIGNKSFKVSLGDVDGDGKVDIVTANDFTPNVSVLRNICVIGIISFAATVNFTTGSESRNVAIGDLDGDGKLDIAIANYNGNFVSVSRNTSAIGTISFAAKVDFLTGHPFGLSISDLDGDGKPELGATDGNGATFSIFKNASTNGIISFSTKVDFITGNSPLALSVGDLDGDGKPDIITSNYFNSTFSYFRNLIGSIPTMSNPTNAITCSGGIVNIPLTSDISATYTWIAADNSNTTGESIITQTTSTLSNTITNNTTSVQTVTYTVTPTSTISTCAGTPQTVTITINPAPISNAGSDLTICSGTAGSIGATAVTGNTYSWNPSAGLSDATISNPDNTTINNTSAPIVTTYTVTTSITATGCQSSDTSLITVNPQPVLTITNPAAVCFPNTVDLIASTVTTGSTGGGILNYWADAGATDVLSSPNSIGTSETDYIKVTALGGCTDIKPVTITVNPLPIVSFSGLDSIQCYNASTQTLTGSPVGGTFSGNGISSNSFNPSIAGSGLQPLTYSFTDGNSCTNTSIQTTEVLPLPIAPSICMSTVDNYSNYNLIYWDKTSYTNVDSFIVYRETTNNVYKRVGAISYDSLSVFKDTVRQLYFPNTGDPNVGTYKYKLQMRDTCGNYSALGLFHKTIYVNQTGGTFTFNDYTIEGQSVPLTELSAYVLLRDDNGNGNWQVLSSNTSSPMNDPNYAYFPNANWRIETQWSISCTPTRTISTTRSNVKGHSVGIANLNEPAIAVSIYPNPFSGNTTITYVLNKKSDVSVEVYNTIGQKVETLVNNSQTAGEYKYNFSAKEKGYNAAVYFVKMIVDGNITMKRIVEME